MKKKMEEHGSLVHGEGCEKQGDQSDCARGREVWWIGHDG